MTNSPLVKPPSEVLEGIIETYRSSLILNNHTNNPNVQNGSDIYNLSLAIANEIGVGLVNVINASNTLMPDTATGVDLDIILNNYGLQRLPAAPAIGNGIEIIDQIIEIIIGSKLSDKNGNLYELTSYTVQKISGKYNYNYSVQSINTGIQSLDVNEILTWIDTPAFFKANTNINFIFFGSNLESDNQARERLFNSLQNPPQFGNWSDSAKIFDDYKPSIIQKAFIYPCAQGSATQHIALTKKPIDVSFYNKNIDFYDLENIKLYAKGQYPEYINTIITSVNAISFDLTLGLNIPYPVGAINNGTGGGWVNFTPWPQKRTQQIDNPSPILPKSVKYKIESGSALPQKGITKVDTVNIRSYILNKTFTVKTFTVIDYLLISPTVLEIVFDDTADPENIFGDLSPSSVNSAQYFKSVIDYFVNIGPGQKTDSPGLLPRTLRQPLPSISYPDSIDGRLLKQLSTNFTEILDTSFIFRTSNGSPPIPANINDPPNIWNLRYISFLPIT